MSNIAQFSVVKYDKDVIVDKITDFLFELLKKENENISNEENHFEALLQVKYFVLDLVSSKVCDFPTLLVGLMYLNQVVSSEKIDLSNFEDLMSLCTVLSSKMWEEMFWSNQDYLSILHSPLNLETFNELEKHILKILNWNLYVSKTEYCNFVDNLCK